MHRLAFALALACPLFAACVPEGPSTGAPATSARPKVVPPSLRAGAAAAALPVRPPITTPFVDTFDRAELGPDYASLTPAWRIVGGRLCGSNAHNRGVWLARKIPENARIEFDAFAETPEGDLKAEIWGDGVSGATTRSYTNATSYLTILGGWKNKKHVLARLDEHGEDRLEIDVNLDSDDERERPVAAGQPYHFKIERSDGKTITWSVNGLVYHERVDEHPLVGPGHEYVGFNDWEAAVCFDNLRVTPL